MLVATSGAGIGLDYATATPDVIAAAVVSALSRLNEALPAEAGGARRAAQLISEIL